MCARHSYNRRPVTCSGLPAWKSRLLVCLNWKAARRFTEGMWPNRRRTQTETDRERYWWQGQSSYLGGSLFPSTHSIALTCLHYSDAVADYVLFKRLPLGDQRTDLQLRHSAAEPYILSTSYRQSQESGNIPQLPHVNNPKRHQTITVNIPSICSLRFRMSRQ